MLLTVLVAVVTGCDGTPRYDTRLAAADSLVRDNPDSALAIVEAINRGSLATTADSAYHDLLLTQARYRCYIVATSDSDINRALAYYRSHDNEREKLTRAYIYKGAVMEELGHPDSAMLYYKHAEATAAPDDYSNLGYCNLRIAQLYQNSYANDSAVVSRMKIASRYFSAIADTSYLITAIGTQGAYPKILGEDSARFYLERAIQLSQSIHSSKGYQYQSKLVGLYFYNSDFLKAKELAMDIVRNGSDNCNEQQFYFYAARAYIQLNLIDSARWVMSVIPPLKNAVDSMNNYQMLADLARATHNYSDYTRYSEAARKIDTGILETSRDSKLTEIEWNFNATRHETDWKNKTISRYALVGGLALLTVVVLLTIFFVIIRLRVRYYKNQLETNKCHLEKLIDKLNMSQVRFDAEKEKHRLQLAEKDTELAQVSSKNKKLEQEQESVNKQVASIVRHRLAALNELYQSIRIKSTTDDGRKRTLLLVTTIRELYEKRGILHTLPKDSFWKNLKKSVDGEFEGIATFVEQNYPKLSEKDMQLFLLLCADFPNQIIKMCMNYTNDVTVSKNKKKLMREQFGLDVKWDEFINMYLNGELGPQNRLLP